MRAAYTCNHISCNRTVDEVNAYIEKLEKDKAELQYSAESYWNEWQRALDLAQINLDKYLEANEEVRVLSSRLTDGDDW